MIDVHQDAEPEPTYVPSTKECLEFGEEYTFTTPPRRTALPKPPRPDSHGKNGNLVKPGERRKTGERFATANGFADAGARLVDTTAQAVWWILWRDTKPDGLARTSFGRIAECVGRSRRTVIRAIGQLAEAGFLTIVRRGSLHQGASTYRVHGTPKRG